MYPQYGSSIPSDPPIHAADLDLLTSLGANFVRGCHYPQDQRFLDLCDEKGVLVWEETLAWGNSVPQLRDPLFMQAQLATAHAMVDASINHPSVSAKVSARVSARVRARICLTQAFWMTGPEHLCVSFRPVPIH